MSVNQHPKRNVAEFSSTMLALLAAHDRFSANILNALERNFITSVLLVAQLKHVSAPPYTKT
jgi:hypothetical protein